MCCERTLLYGSCDPQVVMLTIWGDFGAVLQPRELRALMAELEPTEVAVAGQAVALSQWHAVSGPSMVLVAENDYLIPLCSSL